MKRVHIDKIASSLRRLSVASEALLSAEIVAAPGYVVAVRVLEVSPLYDELEDRTCRMVKLYPGDVIAGVLGSRKALHGHAGEVPASIRVGDELHLLNLGGVIGRCTSSHAQVGPPIRLEVLGAVLAFPVVDSRQGVPAHLSMSALEPVAALDPNIPPVIFVSGTCMNSGKTLAAVKIVRALVGAGKKVVVAKLTGVAAAKDTMAMLDCGASQALTFVDAGIPSTTALTALPAARAVLAALARPNPERPDVIVAELGDGLLGEYGVLSILTAEDVRAIRAVHVCCAADPVGAYGAVGVFATELECQPDVFSGPVTDNAVGINAIANRFGIGAHNAKSQSKQLGDAVLEALERVQRKVTPPRPIAHDGDTTHAHA